jgi:hypothetical protein
MCWLKVFVFFTLAGTELLRSWVVLRRRPSSA